MAPGILFHDVRLPRGSTTSHLWIYLPEVPGQRKLPCVLIAPAGSALFHGMALGEGDRPEHLPYVRAGFAVVAYEIDGPLGARPSTEEVLRAAAAYQTAEAGLANARDALRYVCAKVPQVDIARVYTAGHSSAATLSLLVAEHVPGIKACVAYAPVGNVEGHLGEAGLGPLSAALPGFRDFIRRHSPDASTARLRCPTFLFHAADDSNVPAAEVQRLAARLRKTNRRVTWVIVPTGDHYDSMIQQGIPRAIRWLKALPTALPRTGP